VAKTPETSPSGDDEVSGNLSQAAVLPLEEEVPEPEDDDESEDEVVEEAGFADDAGELLDEEPRLSLR
jgi:hypothetical protein